ncbi:hypothetical protein GH714_000062 [Hevea brasiliensis]|uniref:DRBM domain-containing protein n=1 Tax=Hevea brasiliensis TaxID=3981 RepID=A0A6A6NA92_HEVBR|nr:hypothetical protein GH714_000062 [Hevea brasiliensis]
MRRCLPTYLPGALGYCSTGHHTDARPEILCCTHEHRQKLQRYPLKFLCNSPVPDVHSSEADNKEKEEDNCEVLFSACGICLNKNTKAKDSRRGSCLSNGRCLMCMFNGFKKKVRKIKTVARYVPKAVKPSPQEEGTKAGKLFDHEANTEADLLADRNLVYNKNNPRDDEDDACNCCIKHMIDSNNTISKTQTQSKVVSETSMDDKAFHNNSGKQKNASAKSQLHEICAANNWKPPLFECCKEEGPSHLRLFTFKVSMEIEGAAPSASILQCFGALGPKRRLQQSMQLKELYGT